MTSGQYLIAIAKLGLTQVEAGEFLGRSGRQGQRWASGEVPVPESVAKLLRLMLKLNLQPKDVK
jgi:hypothetical protein